MNNSIQYFLENGIPGLEKIKKYFLMHPLLVYAKTKNVKNNILSVGNDYLIL